MWWILQIIACAGVTTAIALTRHFGLGTLSWSIYTGIAATLSYWAFAKSYATAPTFFSGWFVGQTALNIFGLLVAFLIFKDYTQLTNYQWLGMVFATFGGYLLIR
jgi:F0F1-type ATP synthase membrane subunit c/vacuolar-type H+-ATPase subunit K